jgi:hypothetical protein
MVINTLLLQQEQEIDRCGNALEAGVAFDGLAEKRAVLNGPKSDAIITVEHPPVHSGAKRGNRSPKRVLGTAYNSSAGPDSRFMRCS